VRFAEVREDAWNEDVYRRYLGRVKLAVVDVPERVPEATQLVDALDHGPIEEPRSNARQFEVHPFYQLSRP
jgi:hypothetical protein